MIDYYIVSEYMTERRLTLSRVFADMRIGQLVDVPNVGDSDTAFDIFFLRRDSLY
jgi:hypothetical protein